MPAPSDVMKRNQRTRTGSKQYADLKQKIQKALGQGRVDSVTYVGMDDSGRPIYRISYTLNIGMGSTAGMRSGSQPGIVRKISTLAFSGGQLSQPRRQGKGTPSASGGDPRKDPKNQARPGATSTAVSLQAAKDKWLTQIAGMNLPLDAEGNPTIKQQIIRSIHNFRGSVFGLNAMVEQQLAMKPVMDDVGQEEDFFDPYAGFGDGFGSGFTGPQYVAPDRRVVEDYVKGTMVSLYGEVHEDKVKTLTDLYMKDHRRNFDSIDKEIDPAMSVVEAIRNTGEYQAIHELRPESEDERTWVAQRRQAAAEGGLNTELQEDFAIQQAVIGGDLDDAVDAAGVTQFQHTGQVQGTTLESKMRESVASLFRGVY